MNRIAIVLAATLFLAAPTGLSGQTMAPPVGQVSFMIFGDPAERDAYQNLVKAFNRKNPRITIDLIHVPSQTAYRRRLAADFAGGTPADITLINYRRYAGFAARGVLAPLGPYLAQSKVLKEADFYKEALEPFYWRGSLMCIPQNLSSLVVYYNKNLFERAGVSHPGPDWTWDDFLRAAKALTRDTNGDGVADQHGLGTEASIFRVAPFIWQNGGDLVDNPKLPTRLTLDTPAAKEAVQWFIDLQVKHKVMPDAVHEKSESSESRFQNGRLGMFLNSRRGVPTYREITAFKWDVAPLPRGKQRAGILHADAFCMSSKSANKAATWAFIEFAMSAEGQTIVAESGRTVPSLRSVANSKAFLNPEAAPANSRVFLDVIPHIRAVPVMETWVDIEETIGKELERGVYGQATIDEVISASTRRTLKHFAH